MEHKGTMELKTPRLTLRRVTVADAPEMYNNWASDSEVTHHLTWQPHESVEMTAERIGIWVEGYSGADFYLWGIDLDGEGLIGTISVVGQSESSKAASIGYCIGKKWWGRGIMPEALKAVIAFLFEQVGFGRIEARHDVLNPNSGAVMKKAGMTYEGTLRRAAWSNTGINDVAIYSILYDEYMSSKN